MMKKNLLFLLSVLLCLSSCGNLGKASVEVVKSDLRAPAYPLVTIDPYTSAWSMSDCLYDTPVKHWTGHSFPLLGVLKVDGKPYRFMGDEELELYPVSGTSEQQKWEGKYTTKKPASGWEKAGFNDAAWKTGQGAFGTMENEPMAKTQWGEEFIWVRRVVDVKEDLTGKNVYLQYSHDDDVIIYINGVKVVDTGNAVQKRANVKLSGEVLASLKKGENLIAAYCHNRMGNGLLDFGLMAEKDNTRFFKNTAVQKEVNAQATQTYYTFACGPVDLRLKFTAPVMMDNLDVMTRPVNYLTYEVTSTDGAEHEVELYLEAGNQWAIDAPGQATVSEVGTHAGMKYAKVGSVEQPVLKKKGDDVRIDWGYFYLTDPQGKAIVTTAEGTEMRRAFINGAMQAGNEKPEHTKLCLNYPLGRGKQQEGYVMLAYDDVYSIQYFGQNLHPYWNRDGNETIFTQLEKAKAEYKSLLARCAAFDYQLITDAAKVGGKKYAELCALAYRQVMAAHKLVESPQGELLYLSKENFSNGSINTVDLTYPSCPMYLLYNPELQKGMMNGIFYYSESGKWPKPFAAHDLGTYPLANGQTYGGDMPVEESGNMLILCAAIAKIEGNADYAKKHWNTLTTWANYLVENGLDPENQLCTDDFAGHFAHNANLSIKAILGIASYGYLAGVLGDQATCDKYMVQAKSMATEWEKMANDGDHYRLTFDKPGTWSQKYNLVWDRLLNFNVFDPQIAEKELAFYPSVQNTYGLPLDCRETYTKSDWIMWTAVMAKDQAGFEELIAPIYKFMNETPNRVPMTDWSWTLEPNQRGFQARSVIGGYFLKMLEPELIK